MKQVLFLMLGFFIGQGSMFLFQSYLVFIREVEIIATLGLGLGLLSLVQWVSDGGGVFLLSKKYLDGKKELNIFSFIVARALVGFIFFIIFYMMFFLLGIRDDILSIFSYGWLVLLIWSFNVSGVIDSENKNKIIGPTSSLCWFFSTIYCFLFFDKNDFFEYLGLIYSFGLLVTVLLQWYVVRCHKINVFIRNDFFFIADVKLVLIYNFSYVLAQGYARFVPIIIDKTMDSFFSGLYIYAKNVSNLASQVIQFTRRIEFKRLVIYINDSNFSHKSVLIKQKYSFIMAILFLLSALLALGAFYLLKSKYYFDISLLVFFMSCLVVMWVFVSGYGQIYLASDNTFMFSVIISTTSALGILFVFMSIDSLGVFGVFISEFVMYLVQLSLYLFFINRVGSIR